MKKIIFTIVTVIMVGATLGLLFWDKLLPDSFFESSRLLLSSVSPSSGPGLAFGTYRCKSCSKPYDWHIDKNHVLLWDGNRYIPHAINEFNFVKNDITTLKKEIDDLFSAGITNFFIDGYSVDIFGKGGYNEQVRQTYDAKLKQLTDYINQKGGTFIFSYKLHFVVDRLKGDRSISFFLNSKTQQAFRDDLTRMSKLISTPALRAVEFSEEMNALDPIARGNPGSNLSKVLDIYGGMVKETIGDVPVLARLGDSLGNKTVVRPYLAGICRSENFDGINMQIHGAMPSEIDFFAQRLSIPAAFNGCASRKLYWAYSQATPGSFSLFRSKELMSDAYNYLAENGVTGILYDQQSSVGLTELGQPADPAELRKQNIIWFGKIKNSIRKKILAKAKNEIFSPAKMPFNQALLQYKTSSLVSSKVSEIAGKDSEAQRLIGLGAKMFMPGFNRDHGYWQVSFGTGGDSIWSIYIDDPSGKIVLNNIKSLNDARKAGYPLPSDQQILQYLGGGGGGGGDKDGNGSKEPGICSVGNETGSVCSSREKCSTREWVNGCCIGGVCN